jgi:mannose-6-phosphate isomerase-like protein (cupin superfamily)
MEKIILADKFSRITDHFRPRVIAQLNGQEVKAAKVKGEFIWHHHEHEDELFLVVRGALRIEFRDRAVTLGPGEMVVVPRGVEHRPVAEEETEILLFEPAATRNTGNVVHETLTAPDGVRI